jgi:hypothetical protein
MLDTMTVSAAFVRNGRMDILASNALGRALYSPMFADQRRPANIARYQFLDPGAQNYFPELSTLSEEFRARWAAHNVRIHHAGMKQFNHPEVGPLDLVYHSLDLAADDDWILDLTIYSAEPGTPLRGPAQAPRSWAATHLPEQAAAEQAR